MVNSILSGLSKKADLRPVMIPETDLGHYISFKHALNLRYPNEDTGDWHFQSAFFYRADCDSLDYSIPLAGLGETVNTVVSLGTKGIRDMSQVMAQAQIPTRPNQPVYVANHYRAITDIAMLELQQARLPSCATNQAINSWLDTPEQIEHLKQHYLEPLENQLSGKAFRVFQEWMLTVSFA